MLAHAALAHVVRSESHFDEFVQKRNKKRVKPKPMKTIVIKSKHIILVPLLDKFIKIRNYIKALLTVCAVYSQVCGQM